MSSADPTPLIAAVSAVAALAQDAPIVLIDGPSGAGKTTLADALVDAWPGAEMPTLVRLEDVYPGWGGLDAASGALVTDLLEPLHHGAAAGWRRHDWVTDTPAEWHPVAPAVPLLIEGCGSISRGSAPLAELRIWLGADDIVRKNRALARDHGEFDAHWDEWQEQFERFVARERPQELADLLLDGTAS